jgi:hypothetical protein
MLYKLYFLDEARRLQDVSEAEIESDQDALRWMRIVGAAWGLHSDWSVVEMWRQGRCVARFQVEIILGELENEAGIVV